MKVWEGSEPAKALREVFSIVWLPHTTIGKKKKGKTQCESGINTLLSESIVPVDIPNSLSFIEEEEH